MEIGLNLFGVFVGYVDVVMQGKNGLKMSNGFTGATGGKTHVSQ